MRALPRLGMALVVLLTWVSIAGAQKWQPLKHQPSFQAGPGVLLTDGTVMMHEYGGANWWRLTPDNKGSYLNGTWKQLASLPSGYSPLYYASAVLPDGRVIVEGGEYNNFQAVWTNLGAIYDPLTDKWKSVNPPSGWSTIGDAQSVILPNGTFMLANCCNTEDALLDASKLTWKATGTGKKDRNDEEGWELLPDKTVLAVDAINAPLAEKYLFPSGKWVSAGNTVVRLEDPSSQELGPAVLRPDGTVFATGANSSGAGHTSVYHPPKPRTKPGKWVPGPDFPNGLSITDGPAALLPSGHVLCQAGLGLFGAPSHFFEYDGKKLTQVKEPPNAPNDPSFVGAMLVLPTGQILWTDFSQDVEIYTAKGTFNQNWAPTITTAPSTVTRGQSYSVSGTQFNGLSQGAMYGDDAQMATNFPLVRLTNHSTKHVFYARTHDHSTMAVATKGLAVSTTFDVPGNMETGDSDLQVVANGIPSDPVVVTVQ